MSGDCQMSTSGYSFMLVVAACTANFLAGGLSVAVGVYFTTFLEVLKYDDPSQVALGITLVGAANSAIGPIAGVLINRFGCRYVCMLGGLLSGAGLALATLSTNVHYMCFMFGAVCGAGLGLIYMTTMVSLSDHFSKYRPMAVATASSCMGVGIFLFPLIIRETLNYYGWRGSVLLISGITFHGIVCGVILQGDTQKTTSSRRLVNLCIFKNKDFVLFCASCLVVRIGLAILFVHLGAYATSIGLSEYDAALLYTTWGGASIFGRFLYAGAMLLPRCTGLHIYTVGFSVLGLSLLSFPFANSHAMRYIFMVVAGLSNGGYGVCLVEITILILGKELTANGLGGLFLFRAIGGLVGGPCGSFIYESTGNYANSMYFGGSAIVFGTLLMLIPLCARHRSNCGTGVFVTKNNITETQARPEYDTGTDLYVINPMHDMPNLEKDTEVTVSGMISES